MKIKEELGWAAPCAALVLALTALSGCGGGAPSELELKGLRLGMPVKEAARAMVGHGFSIGGEADPGYNTWAYKEHAAAARGYTADAIRKICAERGFASLRGYIEYMFDETGVPPEERGNLKLNLLRGEAYDAYKEAARLGIAAEVKRSMEAGGLSSFADYLRDVMPPELYDQHALYIQQTYRLPIENDEEWEITLEHWFEKDERSIRFVLPAKATGTLDPLAFLEEFDPAALSLEGLEEREGGIGELPPGHEPFPDLDAYIADRYPDGRPYHLGGPWDGESDLIIEREGVFGGDGWAFGLDGDGRVTSITLEPMAADKLFNTGDMSGQEFVQSFIDAYGIPEMEYYVDSVDPDLIAVLGKAFRAGWVYVDRANGWSLTITENKRVTLASITSGSETAFD